MHDLRILERFSESHFLHNFISGTTRSGVSEATVPHPVKGEGDHPSVVDFIYNHVKQMKKRPISQRGRFF